MLRKLILVIIITLISTSQSFALNGERKGFVLGIGMGVTPYANPDMKRFDNDFSFMGLGSNMFLGYGINNNNLIQWEIIGAFNNGEYGDGARGFVAFNGINWVRYLKSEVRSFYSVIGIGRIATVSGIDRTGYISHGSGIQIGAGYEFEKHVQLSISYVGGKSSSNSFDVTTNMIMFSASVIGY